MSVVKLLADHRFNWVDFKVKVNVADSFMSVNDGSIVVHF